MIVWLASYPRSGNTLLRTIFKQTMNLGSYSDEVMRPELGLTQVVKDEFGHLLVDEPWEEFYERASAGAEVHLVKTHLPPRDAQPVIYVVRDGRQALVSYDSYHRKFFPDHPGGLIRLVLGDDYYGGWSSHHARWMSGKRRTMLVHYEDLVAPSEVLLRELAQFVGHVGSIAPWVNPFERLQRKNPDFFPQGDVAWRGAPGWTPLVDGSFLHIHGDLMLKLGYLEQEWLEQSRRKVAPDVVQFFELVRSLVSQKEELDHVCRERLAAIHSLDDEVKALTRACGERLAVINALDSSMKELDCTCKERLGVINVLDAEVKRLNGILRSA